MEETKFHDEQGNEVQFARKDDGQSSEITFIKHTIKGDFISHSRSLYFSDKLHEWSSFSKGGELISRHVMEYCAEVWDAWNREFDSTGKLLKQTFYTWDKTYQAKAELYYDADDEYLGKTVFVLENGKCKSLVFNAENNLINSD